MRHVRRNDGQLDDLMGVIRDQVGKARMATCTHFWKKGNGSRRFQQHLLMAGMPGLAARLPALSGGLPAVALCRRRIGWRRPARVGGVLVHARCERCEAFEEGEHHKTHTPGRVLPILNGYVESRMKGCGSQMVTHYAGSSYLVSPSLPQNKWGVSMKVLGVELAGRIPPRDQLHRPVSSQGLRTALSHRQRPHVWKRGIRDVVMEVCGALHNFRVCLTPWQPMI
jgi:hypothetical protein